MAAIDITRVHPQILLVTFPAYGSLSDLDDFLVRREAHFAAGEPFAVVVNIDRLDPRRTEAVVRRRLAEGIDDLVRRYPGVQIAEAIVANGRILRGLVTAHQWLRKGVSPHFKVVATNTEAIRWAKERLRILDQAAA